MKIKKIIFGSDHAGNDLINQLESFANTIGFETQIASQTTQMDYVDAAKLVADLMVQHEQFQICGVLVCGSGIGISMAANRYRHIRAALCHTPFQASLARQHNNANVLCLGARFIDLQQAVEILKTFLESTFEGGRHEPRVDKLGEI